MERLNRDHQAGRVSDEDYQKISFALGQQAGAARGQYLTSRLHGYEIQQQREDAHRQLESQLGDAWKPENRAATTQTVMNFVREMNLPSDILDGIESADSVRALVQAAQNHSEVADLRAKVQSQSAQIRRLTGQGKVNRQRSQKSLSVGSKQDSDWAINEVAKLLGGE